MPTILIIHHFFRKNLHTSIYMFIIKVHACMEGRTLRQKTDKIVQFLLFGKQYRAK